MCYGLNIYYFYVDIPMLKAMVVEGGVWGNA